MLIVVWSLASSGSSPLRTRWPLWLPTPLSFLILRMVSRYIVLRTGGCIGCGSFDAYLLCSWYCRQGAEHSSLWGPYWLEVLRQPHGQWYAWQGGLSSFRLWWGIVCIFLLPNVLDLVLVPITSVRRTVSSVPSAGCPSWLVSTVLFVWWCRLQPGCLQASCFHQGHLLSACPQVRSPLLHSLWLRGSSECRCGSCHEPLDGYHWCLPLEPVTSQYTSLEVLLRSSGDSGLQTCEGWWFWILWYSRWVCDQASGMLLAFFLRGLGISFLLGRWF